MTRPTIREALAECHGVIAAMDRVRPDVPDEKREAFEREYSQAIGLRDALVVGEVRHGLGKRLGMIRAHDPLP